MIAFCTLFTTFSFGQVPEIIYPETVRKKVTPCELYTQPGSTVNLWDWRITRYQFNYKPSNAPAYILEVDSPFHNDQGFSFSPNTAHFAYHPGEPNDYQVVDGWELLYRNFGTTEDPVGEPSFGLYNRYDARVRIFYYIEPNGESTYQNARISARHYEQGAFNKISALFEHLNIPSNALSQFDKSGLAVSQLNEVIINGTWMYLEFAAAYDPCVCLHPSAVEVKPILSNVQELSFTLEGTGTSNAIYPTSNASPSFLDYSRTALKYGNGFYGSIVSGYKVYKTINDIPSGTEGILGIAANLPSWFTTAGATAKILGFLIGGGKSSASSRLMGFNHDFKFDGIGNITTYTGYDPILFYTPGAFFDYNQPKANRPVYDNPLGIFTLLEPPVIESSHEDYVSGNSFGHRATYKFKGDIKYAVNQLAGINEMPIRLMGALVFPKCKKNVIGPGYNYLTEEFYSTPLINIECLPDYIHFGSEFHDNTYDVHSTTGCISAPELQIVAVLENILQPTADDILFTARYKTEFIDADYGYFDAPLNPYEGMTTEEIFAICDPAPPTPIAGDKLIQFCQENYDPNVDKSMLGVKPDSGQKEIILPLDGIYPNPFSDYFVIEIPEAWVNQETNIQLQDALGKVVWEKSFYIEDVGYLQIQEGLSALPKGQYFAQVKGESFISSFKLIKQ